MAMGAPSGMNLMGMDLVSPSLLLRLALRSPAMTKIWVSYGLALVLILLEVEEELRPADPMRSQQKVGVPE